MPDTRAIQLEIGETIEKKYADNKNLSKILKKAKEEMDILSGIDGLEKKNNLETFYNIWRNNRNKTGHKNDINSWTAYFLGMTTVKPEKEAKFLPTRRAFARAGFPDVDTDFDYENRDKVYSYIISKYGRENVGNIGTHGMLKFKSCVTRVTKALDLADSFHKGKDAFVTDNVVTVNEILSPFPKHGLLKINDDEGNSHLIKTFDDAYTYCSDFKHYVDRYEESDFKRYAEKIEGTFANFGYHAAGVVISDSPIAELAPLRLAKGGVLATQYPMEDLEMIGLIKHDILALSTLTVIRKTLEMIEDYWGIKIDEKNLPVDDEPTLKLYRDGNLGGVFQCEKGGMQRTMRDIGVDRFEDIMAALALYRPGPMDSIPAYCDRKRGGAEVDYFHESIQPFVESYLNITQGIAIYQEQIMQICNSLAGFTITDGYIMIKAIGKKKKNLLAKFEKQFVDGCVSNKVPRDVAQQYWDKFITPFASYGFNVAHSTCYAYNSYTTAYLKANYPDEFICSLLNVTINTGAERYEKAEAFEREFRRKMNIKFLARDINKSKADYIIEKRQDLKNGIKKTEIRPSLLCKGLRYEAAKNIEENQPYDDMADIIEKTDSSLIGTRALDALIEGGYFGKKAIDKKEEMIKKFKDIREGVKKIAKKKMESVDIFA